MIRTQLIRPVSVNALRLCRKALWIPAIACACLPLAAQVDYATPYTFSFFAGNPGSAGSADGTGTGALFDLPNGLALDSNGNLYVADKKNDTIRKVTSGGVVTTLAGSPGVVGTADATGSAATFNQPEGVAVGSGGDIYVADTSNDVIRKVTSAGVVTSLAGTFGTAGSTDGTGTAGLFNQPAGVAVDSSGNVYVADFGNDEIRKVTSGGVVTTIAGAANTPGTTDATGTAARFNQPIAIAIDSSGNLYIADNGNNTIRKMTSAGVVTTLAGNPGVAGSADGSGSQALFKGPRGIAVDSAGNLYVSDGQNCTIRKVTPSGAVTTLAGSPGSFALSAGTGASAYFDVPVGIAVTSSGTLYVANSLGYVISSGTEATNIAPSIVEEPTGQTIATGDTVVFQAQSYGLPAPTLQWYLNGTALVDGNGISGSTTGTLVLSGATAANAGSYTVVATNASGPATSSAATLDVVSTSNPGRLTNISCRALVGTGSNVMIAGFVVGGAGTSGSQSVLVRASGPALGLTPFNIPGVLPDPVLTLSDVSESPNQVVATDTGWDGAPAIATAAASLGAFPWGASSEDSAVLASLPESNYTAEVAGSSGDTGIGLVEVYDATPSGTFTLATPRLTNLSARVQVGTGANTVYAGFVIGGSTSKTVLIRASGPALSLAPFSLTGTLPDPQLTLTNVTTSDNFVVASNTVWGGNAAIATAAAQAGAFAWGSTSLDSALLVSLPPGNYTAGVTGSSGDTGTALIEIYEIP